MRKLSILLPVLFSLLAFLLFLTAFQKKASSSPPISEQSSIQQVINGFQQAKTYENIRFDSALIAYQAALDQWNQIKSQATKEEWRMVFPYLYDLIIAYSTADQNEEALQLTSQLQKEIPSSFPPSDSLNIYLSLSAIALNLEKETPQNTLKQLETIEQLFSQPNILPKAWVKLQLLQATTLSTIKKKKNALARANKAKKQITNGLYQKKDLAPSLIKLGNIYLAIDQIDSLKSCLKLADQIKIDKKDLIDLNFLKSKTAQREGIFNNIIIYAEKALEMGEDIYPGDMVKKAGLYNQVAIGYWRVGQVQKAIDYSKKSINNLQINGETQKANRLKINLGTFYKAISEYEQANAIYEEALDYFAEKKDPKIHYSILNQLGVLRMYMEDYDESKDYFFKALSIARDDVGDYHTYIFTTLFNLGRLHILQEKYEEAESFLNQAVEITQNIPMNWAAVSDVNYRLGRIKAKQKNYRAALTFFQEAIKPLVPSFSPSNLIENPPLDALNFSQLLLSNALAGKAAAFYNIALENNTTQDIENALQTSDHVLAHIEHLRSSFRSDVAKNKLMNLATLVYSTAIKTSLLAYEKQKDPALFTAAFQYAEKTKSVLLNEGLKETKAKLFSNIPETLLQKESEYRVDIGKLQETIRVHKQEKKEEQELVLLEKELIEKKEDYEALINNFEENYPDYHRIKYDFSVANVEKVQNFLTQKPSTALLEYFLQDSTLIVFAITKDTFFHAQEIVKDTFFDRIDSLQKVLSNKEAGIQGEAERKEEFDKFVDHSSYFYKKLLRSFEDKADVSNIIIVPDTKLGYLPFQVFLSQTPDASERSEIDYRNLPYLFLEHNIRYAYSASLLFENTRYQKPTSPYTGFAPVYNHSKPLAGNELSGETSSDIRAGLDSLAYNQPEVSTSASFFGGQSYLGKAATEDAFKIAAPSAQIIHLAMHTVLNDQSPLYTQLLFTKVPDSEEDGNLNAYELYNMQLNADLAVISACESGIGKLQKGEGIMSLSRAFKYAGCPNIVTSLWKASDASTKNIMVAFFENLKAGKRKDLALKQARQNYLFGVKEDILTHPFYWATFILIGDEQPVKFRHPSMKFLWLGLGISVIIIVWFGWRWRKQLAVSS